MNIGTLGTTINRRRALALGGSVAAGGLLTNASLGTLKAAEREDNSTTPSARWQATTNQIEQIIQAQGMFSDGVFSIEIDREDITNVTLQGVPISPSFQINGTLYFQEFGPGRAVMNGDMALKASEINPFIDQLLSHNLVFQAEHQHFYDFSPLVWYIHFRAAGDPLQIAHAVKAALNVTSTPFPQTMPQNPTTPLPSDELGTILGATPSIGSDGVVNFDVPREDPIWLGGIRINPYLNVSTSISFEPYGGGQNAAVVADIGLVASEINRVMATMRQNGWDIGCLYNQETDEVPQLYFSHQFKAGDAVQLAHEVRAGLNRTDSKFKS